MIANADTQKMIFLSLTLSDGSIEAFYNIDEAVANAIALVEGDDTERVIFEAVPRTCAWPSVSIRLTYFRCRRRNKKDTGQGILAWKLVQDPAHTLPEEFVAEMVVTFDAALERRMPFFDKFVYVHRTASNRRALAPSMQTRSIRRWWSKLRFTSFPTRRWYSPPTSSKVPINS